MPNLTKGDNLLLAPINMDKLSPFPDKTKGDNFIKAPIKICQNISSFCCMYNKIKKIKIPLFSYFSNIMLS